MAVRQDLGGISVNCVTWNNPSTNMNLFVTVDESSHLKLWETNSAFNSVSIKSSEGPISNGAMATCAIDPIEGKFVACGGIDGKLHIYQLVLNHPNAKANDKTMKHIHKSLEFSGH